MTKIEDWILRSNKQTQDFLTEFDPLSSVQLNWQKDETTWSIAQILEHIIKINESYKPIFESMHKNELKISFLGKFTFIQKMFGKIILKSVIPETKKKTKTLPIWKPNSLSNYSDILSKYSSHKKWFIEQLLLNGSYIEKNVTIYSPANKNVVYKIQDAYGILVMHELRHFYQALEIKNSIPRSIV